MARKKEQPYTSKLRGVDLLLGDSPDRDDVQSSPPYLSVKLIQKPKQQPRRYFDSHEQEQLLLSIKQHGILEPLLVRPLAQGQYELVAGERRLRAAIELNLTEVPVIIKQLTDEEAIQVALIENLQRVDLNPVEETEAILQLLSIQLQQEIEQIITLLYRMQNEAKGKVTQNVLGNFEGEKIKSVFNSLGIISWESFVSSRLPLLKLPREILESLRQGQIAYTKASAIAKVKSKEDRISLLAEAINSNLSLREIKEKIKQLQPKQKSDSPGQRIDKLVKELNKAKPWEKEPKKWRKLQGLLTKIEAILQD